MDDLTKIIEHISNGNLDKAFMFLLEKKDTSDDDNEILKNDIGYASHLGGYLGGVLFYVIQSAVMNHITEFSELQESEEEKVKNVITIELLKFYFDRIKTVVKKIEGHLNLLKKILSTMS